MQNNTKCLANKFCVPCQGDIPPLSVEAVNNLLEELGNGWIFNETMHLYKEYKFPDFIEAMEFANKIAEITKQEQHHPNLKISWGECIVEIWTHKIEGLTESDFVLAAKIELIS